MTADEQDAPSVKRRGRPRKKRRGKGLFDEQSSSEEEDLISASDHENAQEEENKQDEEDDDEDAPLIQSFRSSAKLRALRVAREETKAR